MKKTFLNCDRRRDISRNQWKLFNVNENKYHREIDLRFFENIIFDDQTIFELKNRKSILYCSIYYSKNAIFTKTHETLNIKTIRNFKKRFWYIKQLQNWKKQKTLIIFDESFFKRISTLIMSNKIFNIFCVWDNVIVNNNVLKQLIEINWNELNEFNEKLINIFRRDCEFNNNDEKMIKKRLKIKILKNVKKRENDVSINSISSKMNQRKKIWLIQYKLRFSQSRKMKTTKKKSIWTR